MLSFLIKWCINIVALFVVINTISGVSAANSSVLIIAALIIGLLNVFLKPILVLLTLPFTILSLGAFTLIINAFMFYLTSKFVAGFTVVDFWSAFWAALVFSFISFSLNLLFAPNISLKFGTMKGRTVNRKDYDDAIDVEGTIVDEIKSSTVLKSDKGASDE